MDRQILARTAQANAGLRLVRYLRARFGIKKSNVVGHATANGSPYFKEYTGIKNAAGDWFAPKCAPSARDSDRRPGSEALKRRTATDVVIMAA